MIGVVDLVVLVAATTSLTRLMTHDTIAKPLRDRILAAGRQRSVTTPAAPASDWEPIHNVDGAVVGWWRAERWYVSMLRCARYCAPFWAASAVAGLWLTGWTLCHMPVLALALRGMHAWAWPLFAGMFEDGA